MGRTDEVAVNGFGPTVRTVLQFVVHIFGLLSEEIVNGGAVSTQRIIRGHEPVEAQMSGRDSLDASKFAAHGSYLSLAKVYISSLSSMNFFHWGFSI